MNDENVARQQHGGPVSSLSKSHFALRLRLRINPLHSRYLVPVAERKMG